MDQLLLFWVRTDPRHGASVLRAGKTWGPMAPAGVRWPQAQEEYRPVQSHLLNIWPHLSQCKPLVSHCVLSCQVRGLELSPVNPTVNDIQGGLYHWDQGSPQSVWGTDEWKWKRRASTWLGSITGCMNPFRVSQSSLVTETQFKPA